MPLTVVPRILWGAKKVERRFHMKTPVRFVACAFTREHFNPSSTRSSRYAPPPRAPTIDCIEAMQNQQINDIRRMKDIRYNFVIAPDGYIYKGRGWNCTPGLPHKFKYLKQKCILIGYMGNYTGEPVPDDYLEIKKQLILYGIKNLYVSEKYTEIHFRHIFLDQVLNKLLTQV